MVCAGRTLVWWDRESDQFGRAIRPDVRSAGHDIWEQACQRTAALLGDSAFAAELMENAVIEVSRYLDRIDAPLASRKQGLLMTAFCRALCRQAAKLRRLEFVGGADELSAWSSANGSMTQTEIHLDLDRIVHRLSQRNSQTLMLRAAGYGWEAIASLFGCSIPAIRNSFWREISKIRVELCYERKESREEHR